MYCFRKGNGIGSVRGLKGLFISLCCCSPIFGFSQLLHLVQPAETDARIETFNNNHLIYFNPDALKKDKLFLFLPGTGGVPAVYREILKVAANLGYHAVGLMYPNELAINIACALTLDTTCHSRARKEIITGQDMHPLYSVDSINSISNRLFQLLRYLSDHFPSENWDTFISGDSIHWQKLIVAGHSQGAGHAGFLGTIRRIDRAILIAGMDWIPLFMRPADWHSTSGKTPAENYYGFAHEMDERVNFERLQYAWQASGMMNFGEWVSVDSFEIPYNQSHILSTRAIPFGDPERYHNAPVVDFNTPRNEHGDLSFVPVWEYLIDFEGTVTSAKTGEATSRKDFHIYPNPAFDKCHIVCENHSTPHSVWILDAIGNKTLLHHRINCNFSLQTSHLPPGIYFLQFRTNNDIQTVKLTIAN